MGGWFRFAHVEMTIFRTLSRVALPLLLPGAPVLMHRTSKAGRSSYRPKLRNRPVRTVLPDLSHGRISTLTKSYVLSPFSFEFENGYEGDIFRHDLPVQLFRQEIEMGLPARFTVGMQNQVEHFSGDTLERSFTLEARYALANWNKLPLNPAISAEYCFGLSNGLSDSGELALLISHDFSNLIEWAMNIFVDHEFGGREGTNAGFAQSVEVPVLLPEEKLEVGLEMQYRSGGEPIGSIKSPRGFAIGPTLAWRPTKKARFDLSPLIGCH